MAGEGLLRYCLRGGHMAPDCLRGVRGIRGNADPPPQHFTQRRKRDSVPDHGGARDSLTPACYALRPSKYTLLTLQSQLLLSRAFYAHF